MAQLEFTKMHGLGNDFMVINGIKQSFVPEKAPIAQWANRHFGVGFDQLLLIESTQNEGVDFRYRIFNADGSEVQQCGNGARCFAKFVHEQGLSRKPEIIVETASGIIKLFLNKNGLVTVNMGKPRFTPEYIPFKLKDNETTEQYRYIIDHDADSVAVSVVSMGNPHAVIQVDDTQKYPIEKWGNILQHHERFPEKVNVGAMQIIDSKYINLRVFERGVGETLACGTGACAAVVSGIRLGLLKADTEIRVTLLGGDLFIRWKEGEDVMMTGPAVSVFSATLEY